MKRIIFFVLTLLKRIRSKYYTFLFRRMLHSHGSVSVNNFCKVSRSARVDIGNHFSSNGLIISGQGGGENRRLFSFWN